MTHSDNKFKSEHKGSKSKEVLEQELFSLLTSKGSIKTDKERSQWLDAWSKTHEEYRKRFPDLDWKNEWDKWAKKKK